MTSISIQIEADKALKFASETATKHAAAAVVVSFVIFPKRFYYQSHELGPERQGILAP